jgi:formylglycine-generating enzyme
MRRAPFVVVSAAALACACNAIVGIERGQLGDPDLPGRRDGSTVEAATPDGGGNALLGASCETANECRSRACDPQTNRCVCPEKMVGITRETGSRAEFCIDATEVTNADYARFLFAPLPFDEQVPECAWNTSYASAGSFPERPPNHPVRHIDWCDAHAYCRWAGKRLCGRVGGGQLDFNQASTSESEWYVACTADGARTYPYGTSYDPMACVGKDRSATTSTRELDVGSVATCEGGAEGVFDLSGNVWEFEDACMPDPDGGASPENDLCRRRGGSHDTSPTCLRCEACATALRPRSLSSNETGFRCCAG